jgi:hypothetical protein
MWFSTNEQKIANQHLKNTSRWGTLHKIKDGFFPDVDFNAKIISIEFLFSEESRRTGHDEINCHKFLLQLFFKENNLFVC